MLTLSARNWRRARTARPVLCLCACVAPFVPAVRAQVPGSVVAGAGEAWSTRQISEASLADERIALNVLLREHPTDPRVWVRLGRFDGKLHQFASAEQDLRHALQLDPKDAEAHYLLGLSLVADPKARLDWPGAVEQFRAALQLQPSNANAAMYLGVGLTALGRNKEGVKALQHAAELDAQSSSVWFNLALAQEAGSQDTEAAAAYRHAITLDPNFAAACSGLGRLLLREGDAAGAVKALRQALAANPDLQDAHFALGQALRAQHLPEEAGAEAKIALALGARETDGITSAQKSNAAMARAKAGDLAAAQALLQEAVALRPDYGVPHYNLGLILADQQNFDAAISQLSQAASLMPSQGSVWYDLGRVLRAAGRGQPAVACLHWAAALAPGERTAAELRSAAAQFHQPVADPALQPVLGVASQTPQAFRAYAAELRKSGDVQGAIGMLLRALALDPAAAGARVELAAAYAAAQQPERSRQEYRKVLNVEPDNSQAQAALFHSAKP